MTEFKQLVFGYVVNSDNNVDSSVKYHLTT